MDMKYATFCFFLCALAAPGTSHHQTDYNIQKGRIDEIVDKIIDLFLKKLSQKTIEPVKLTDEVKNFKRKIFGVDVSLEIALYNGKLWGLRTIHRYSDDNNITIQGRQIHVRPVFQFDVLDFYYDFQAQMLKLSPEGAMSGNITKLVVDTELVIDMWNESVLLTKVQLVQARKLTVQVDSKQFVDKVLNYALKMVTSAFKTTILSQLDKEIKNYLGQGINIPLKRPASEIYPIAT